MTNNCQRPELCMLSETCVPCGICPNAKDVNNSRSKNHNRTETMTIDEIPTPETDAAWRLYYNDDMSEDGDPWGLASRLERHLTIEKNRANEMGKLAHANACEAMEYRRLLTIAREALEGVSKNAQPSGPFWHGGEIQTKVREALELTAPKP